jgi:hypothetical protein
MLYNRPQNIMPYLKATAASSSSHLAMSQKLRVSPVGSRMLKTGALQFTIMSCIVGKTLGAQQQPFCTVRFSVYI